MTDDRQDDPLLPPLTEDAASAWAGVLLDLHARPAPAPADPNRDTTAEPDADAVGSGTTTEETR